MAPGVTRQAQELLCTMLFVYSKFTSCVKGKPHEEINRFLLDQGFLEELPSREVVREARELYRKMRKDAA